MITLGQTAYQPSTRMPPASGRWAGWDWSSLYQGVLIAIQYPVSTLNYVRALDYIRNLPNIMVFNYPVLLAAWVRFTKLYPTHNHAAALSYMESLLSSTGRFQATEDKSKWWMIEQEWQSLEGAAPQIRGLSGFPFVSAGDEPALGQTLGARYLTRYLRTTARRGYATSKRPLPTPRGYKPSARPMPTPRAYKPSARPMPTPRGYRPKRLSVKKPVAKKAPAIAVRPKAARPTVVTRRIVQQPIKWLTWPIRPMKITEPRPPGIPAIPPHVPEPQPPPMPEPPQPPPMPEPQPPAMPAGLGEPYLQDEYPGKITLPVIIPKEPSLYPGPPSEFRKTNHKWLVWAGLLSLFLLHEEPARSLLSGVSIKKNSLGYAVSPKERRAGMKLVYFLKLRRRRKPVAISKDSFDYWKNRPEEGAVYATYAYSAQHGREMIVKGELEPYRGEIHRPEEAHVTAEKGKIKPLYTMTHTELVNTPLETRMELPSYIAWIIDKSRPDEYNYQREFSGKLPYKMRGNLYSWLLKNRDGVKSGLHEGQFSINLPEGKLSFYIPENPYQPIRLWINRYGLWRDSVSTQMEQGIPLRPEVVSDYSKHIDDIKRMLSERPSSPEAPEMKETLTKMESSLRLYEEKLQRAREIRERARREVQEELRKPEPVIKPKPLPPPAPARITEPEQLRLFGNLHGPMMPKDWIAAQIRKAIEQDPGRRVHGDTRYNAFFITPEGEIVPFDMINTLDSNTPTIDTISVHSHSANNWRQYFKTTGNLEPFNPLNDMDIQAFQQMVLRGIANTDVVIMADGRMEVLHVPPESEKNFISLQPEEFGILRPTYDYYTSVYKRTGKQAHEVDKEFLRQFADWYRLVYYDDNWLAPEPEPFVKEKPGIRRTFTQKPIKVIKTKEYYTSPFYVEPEVYPGIPEQMELWKPRPPVQQRLLGGRSNEISSFKRKFNAFNRRLHGFRSEARLRHARG